MLAKSHIEQIYNKLIQNDTFCRLMIYDIDPLDPNKEDLVGKDSTLSMLKEVINFTSQSSEMFVKATSRLFIYKGYLRYRDGTQTFAKDPVIISIFVPNRLVQQDFRIYSIENAIINVLDGMHLDDAVGYLEFTQSSPIVLQPITGYTQYDLTFTTYQGRDMFKYGKY